MAVTRPVEVTTTYVQMLERASLRPAREPQSDVALTHAREPSPEFARFLYTAVGGPWSWYTRLPWDHGMWLAELSRDGVEMWVAYCGGTPAGYFELDLHDGDAEIVYFGLLPAFIGRGIGGWLLTRAVERAWDTGASRVWLHTCSLDHPNALGNYLARGFEVYDVETRTEHLPDAPIEPWPGARRPAVA